MKFVLLMIPSLIFTVCCLMAGQYRPVSTTQAAMSSVTFPEFDGAMGSRSRSTDSQKESKFSRYKGERVEWTGIVANAASPNLFIRENATTMTHDIQLVMRDSEEAKLSSLEKNMKVTFRGTIESYGGAVLSHKLIDGEIVSYTRVEPVEMFDLLTRTESTVVDKSR